MIKDLILKNTRSEYWVNDLSRTFYCYDIYPDNKYSINEATGLSYFGEYLERHIQTDISVHEIMAAVVIKNIHKFERYTIYQGQLEMFIDRVNELREKEGNFELSLLTLMFYDKLKLTDKFEELLNEMYSEFSKEDNFLLFTLAVNEGYIKCYENVREMALKFLKEHKFSIDIEYIHSMTKYNSWRLDKGKTSLPAFKVLLTTYSLKKGDFKESYEKFEAYKALKKFGTKDSDYESCKPALNIDAQSFYYSALKLAAESYKTKPGLVRANESLVCKLKDSINVNSNIYCDFADIVFVMEDGNYSGVINLSELDYSPVTKEFYGSLVGAYVKNLRRYNSSEKILCVITREDFLDYLKSSAHLKGLRIAVDIAIDVITHCSDNPIAKEYFNFVKDSDCLRITDVITLCQRGYFDFSKLDEYLHNPQAQHLNSNAKSLQWILEYCSDKKFFDVGVYFIEKVLKDDICCDRYSYMKHEATEFIELLGEEVIKVSDNAEEKRRLFKILGDFIFLYCSEYFVSFLVDYANDGIFREVFEITDDSLKEIGQYLLGKDYVSNWTREAEVRKFVYSDDEIAIDNCKKEVDIYLTKMKAHRMGFDSESLKQAIRKVKNKDILKAYYKNRLDSVLEDRDFMTDSILAHNVRFMVEESIMTKEEASEFLVSKML